MSMVPGKRGNRRSEIFHQGRQNQHPFLVRSNSWAEPRLGGSPLPTPHYGYRAGQRTQNFLNTVYDLQLSSSVGPIYEKTTRSADLSVGKDGREFAEQTQNTF
jgi:hypothetical protein